MSDVLVKIDKLNIVYKLPMYGDRSVRDLFVNIFSNPFETLVKKTESLHVIKNLSLEVKRGDRIGILGVNGSGKTSFCRAIAGMFEETPDIQVFGTIKAIFNTEIGVVPELSGRENLSLIARMMFPEKKDHEILEMVQDSVNFSEIGAFADTPLKNYSKGMKTRIFLSLISSAPSEILILDEVFDGADFFFSEKIGDRVTKMIKDSGAVLFISHSFDAVEAVCNKVVVLKDGQLVFEGDVLEGCEYFRKNCGGFGPMKIS